MFLPTVAFLVLAAIEPGLGKVHFATSTKSAEAQRYFDQGMAYLYGFNHEAAVKSFEQAAKLDPNLGMADWGIALALGPNINLDVDPDREKQAFTAVQSALKKQGSQKERDLIETLAKRYSDDQNADLKKLAADYSRSMGELSKKYPDDLDIATLYAESMMDLRPWKFWSHDGKPAPQTEDIVAVLESVLKRNPQHLGANHYYIHAVEASQTPERALKSADRLNTLAPASGHLVHMPAHIYQRTGNYGGAAKANATAAAVDREFIKKNGAEGIYPMMYYNHNLQFGLASYAMEGRFAEAKKMADEFGGNAAAMAKDMPMLEGAAAAPVLLLARFAKWTDVVAAPPVAAGPMSTSLSHFARGVAMARLGNIDGAERERAQFEESRKLLGDDPGFMQNPARSIGAVAGAILDGRIAEASGDRTKAIRAYRRAVEDEDSLDYDEPPDWFYPTRETLGAALIRDGQFAEAEKVFAEDLKRNPNNPRSYFGLAEAQRKQNKASQMAAARFKKYWHGGLLRLEDL